MMGASTGPAYIRGTLSSASTTSSGFQVSIFFLFFFFFFLSASGAFLLWEPHLGFKYIPLDRGLFIVARQIPNHRRILSCSPHTSQPQREAYRCLNLFNLERAPPRRIPSSSSSSKWSGHQQLHHAFHHLRPPPVRIDHPHICLPLRA